VTRERERRASSATSRHLERIAELARAGTHVVLRGHLRDEVLVEEAILLEAPGLARILAAEAGVETVVVANRADGTYCVDDGQEEDLEELIDEIARNEGAVGPQLGLSHPMGVAATIRLLLRQTRRPVAILLEDPADLFSGRDEQTRAALGVLLEGMAEAAPHRNGSAPRWNSLIVYGSPDGPAVERIAAVPGVEEITVERPNRDERLTALRDLKRHFFRGENGGKPSSQDLEALAGLTEGYSLRALQRLARASHVVETAATRPETLYRRSRGETTETPLARIGVDSIMKRLRREILGQEETLDRVEAQLSLGCWRSANRPQGSPLTRPMATMVLHGPPGVGKTETAQIIAEELLGARAALHRIDCSEYNERHDLARLTGAPPGYVGYEEGGALTAALAEDAAVVLFDEFDRAPRLSEMLLGVLDAGRLTDGRGRTATFENTVLLFTTNLGFREEEADRRLDEEIGRGEFVAENAKALRGEVTAKMGAALWSRLQNSLVGYDMLRSAALGQIVTQSCQRLGDNLGDEFGARLEVEANGFVSLIVPRLPPGADGRAVFYAVQACVEVPLREQLEARKARGRLAAGGLHRARMRGGRLELD
jgi:ATP-dependent Clp protease ATP-binding subunit ClpB